MTIRHSPAAYRGLKPRPTSSAAVIATGAPNPEAAHAWINWLLTPEISIKDLLYHGYHSGHGLHGGQTGIAALTGLAAALAGLLLVPAWARLFTVAWSATLPSLAAGSGERFAWRPHWPSFWLCSLLLAAASAWLAPVLLLAPLAGLCWWAYLKRKLGGMTGDCLGAGIEVCESLLLLALVVAAR